jgi:hypothetical protein
MKKALVPLSLFALLMATSPADSGLFGSDEGYPSKGRAIDG